MLVLEHFREEHEAVVRNSSAAQRMWRMVKICIVRRLRSVKTIPESVRVSCRDCELTQFQFRRLSQEQFIDLNLDSRLENCRHEQKYTSFRRPDGGHKIHDEELLLMALERCPSGTRLIDLQQKYHIHNSVIGKAIYVLASWMLVI